MIPLTNNHHLKLFIFSSIFATSFILQPCTSFADAPEYPTYALDEVIVTATRVKQSPTDIPTSVSTITKDDISKGGYKSVLEALQNANLSIYDSGSSGLYSQSSVFINGDDRVLIMVDGRRINGDAIPVGGGNIRTNLNHLPDISNIEKIEIVRGPASSLYGSDAVGGMINIITRQAQASNTRLKTQYGNWGMRNYSFSSENNKNGLGILITASKKEQDYFKYKDSKSRQIKKMPNSSANNESVSIKLDKELSATESLSLYAQHVDSKVGYVMMPPGFPWHYPSAMETTHDNSIDLNYQWENQSGTEGNVKIYYADTSVNYSPWYQGTPNEIPEYSLMSKTSGIDWQNSWKLSNKASLVGGLTWSKINVDLPIEGINNVETTNKGIFLENNWYFAKNWTLTSGMRHDDHSVYGGKNTARFALNRKINEDTNIYANWGQFYKVPLIVQLYGKKFSWGNPNLRPEEGSAITLGFNTKIDSKTQLQGSIYNSNIDNAITMVVEGSTPISKNVSKQKRRGLNLSLKHQLSTNWDIAAGYSYNSIKEKNSNTNTFQYDPTNNQPNGYNFNLGYKNDKFDSELVLRGATGRNTTAFTANSYWTLDFTANYKIKDNIKLSLKGYNLTNSSYELRALANYPGGFPVASRHLYLGVEYQF